MAKSYDVAVLGLGAMGSAALAHVAGRGLSAVGIERFGPAHDRGSSHGKTRIIRQAYCEDPAYVPLLLRAYELWEQLERDNTEPLWFPTGGLYAGPASRPTIAGTLEAARIHGLRCEVLSPAEGRARFPQIVLREGETLVFEPAVAALFPERCVLAHLRLAVSRGAEARFGLAVDSLESTSAGFVLEVGGERLTAERLVVTAGAWLGGLAHSAWPVRIERNLQHWFAPQTASDASFAPGAFPIFMVDRPDFPRMFYGFPDFGDGVKIAFHHSDRIAPVPEDLDRIVSRREVDEVEAALKSWAPAAAGAHLDSVACMYTMTPDEHFILGEHPALPGAIVAGGFSGHGFKFSSVVGEIVADLVVHGSTAHPIALFDPVRFAGAVA